MSIWTSRTALAAAVLALAGCGGGFTLKDSGKAEETTRAVAPAPISAPTSIDVARGDVTLTGPRGFCVDEASSQSSVRIPFVMFGNCAVLRQDESASQPDHKAVLTASVGPRNSGGSVAGSSDQLSSYFRSDEGREVLSREGNASSVNVIDSFEREGVFYLRASDSSSGPLPGVDAEQWRAYFDVNGRLVSTAILGFKDDPMSSDESLSVLQSFASKIRSDSTDGVTIPAPAPAPVATPAPVAEPAPPRGTGGGLRGVGLLRRILG